MEQKLKFTVRVNKRKKKTIKLKVIYILKFFFSKCIEIKKKKNVFSNILSILTY